jgi:uncharacterized protein YkwD
LHIAAQIETERSVGRKEPAMRKLLLLLCGLTLAALSCYSMNTPTPVPGLVSTIVVQTAQAAYAQTAAAAPPTPTAAVVSSCLDGAALIQDASQAAASLPIGSKFTRAWQLSNSGECSWHGYSVVFVSGERLSAPDSIAVQDTSPGSVTTISVDLTAPASAGSFTGVFELRDATGKAVMVDGAASFSVTVAVADLGSRTPIAGENVAATSGTFVLPEPPQDCKYSKSATYPTEILDLINKARTDAGLPALSVNDKLIKSAQAHSTDMACNAYFDHPGRDKSTIHDRVIAAGYAPKFSEEMIYCGGYPKDAFTWWMGDKPHHDVIVDPRVTELGVGFAYLPRSQCGSYYTVDLAAP